MEKWMEYACPLCIPWIPWEHTGGVFVQCQGIALYFEYLCLLSRCCASLCKAAFPHGLMTGPLMQQMQVVFPALSIQCSPLHPSHTRVHLGWLACKLFGAQRSLHVFSQSAQRSRSQVHASCLPARAGSGVLRRRENIPRPHQATLTLNAFPGNQLLADRFCTEGCSLATALA